jgi:hypothetical protein
MNVYTPQISNFCPTTCAVKILIRNDQGGKTRFYEHRFVFESKKITPDSWFAPASWFNWDEMAQVAKYVTQPEDIVAMLVQSPDGQLVLGTLGDYQPHNWESQVWKVEGTWVTVDSLAHPASRL